jgi:hypothetical protein
MTGGQSEPGAVTACALFEAIFAPFLDPIFSDAAVPVRRRPEMLPRPTTMASGGRDPPRSGPRRRGGGQ